MTAASSARTFEVRHLQLARAAFAALAAVMVTFSPDHSAQVGLGVFSGFAMATGLVFALAAWLVFPGGQRWPAVSLAAVSLAAALASAVLPWRSTPAFFAIVISWALVTGAIETFAASRACRDAADSGRRDGLTVGILTLVLGAVLLLTPAQYALDYTLENGLTYTLTGITIAVGIFGGYAAIVAVYLAIAGFSPRHEVAPAEHSAQGGTR